MVVLSNRMWMPEWGVPAWNVATLVAFEWLWHGIPWVGVLIGLVIAPFWIRWTRRWRQ